MLRATVISIAIIVLLLIGLWVHNRPINQPRIDDAGQDPATPTDLNSVELTPSKERRMKLSFVTVERQPWRTQTVLPGRLDYNPELRVPIRVACDGIVARVDVQPGDKVERGQILAIVNSPEVGKFRAEVEQRQAEVELARNRLDWQASILDGVRRMAELIQSDEKAIEFDKRLSESLLGDFRAILMSAYTRYREAELMSASLDQAADRGAISEKIRQQRALELQSARAALKAALEQSKFDAEQAAKESRSHFESACRQKDVSLQALASLLGPANSNLDGVNQIKSLTPSQNNLSQLAIVSPMNGTIEERLITNNSRVIANEPLLVIANTAKLWALADVHEQEWSAMQTSVGQSVSLTSSAIPNVEFAGHVIMLGRRVDLSSGTASVIVELDAEDQRLRPGLFIRMTLATGPNRSVLVVPEQSIVVHEGQAFVFVPDGERRFTRRDVTIGETQNRMSEVLTGLEAGTKIVHQGAFLLKSELLLQQETE